MNNNKSGLVEIKPFIVKSVGEHSMGAPVLKYLEIKMHDYLRDHSRNFKKILVIGEYDRTCSISSFEKDGKTSNWQRPTAEIINDELIIKCFPGKDYVRHYASLIASYLYLTDRKWSHVRYVLPTEAKCEAAVDDLFLENIPVGDVLIIGSGLPAIAGEDRWEGNNHYLYKSVSINNQTVVFLIFQFSFWGDILYRIIKKMGSSFKKILFTAKVGGIRSDLIPNETLATGSQSFIDGEFVSWKGLFEDVTSPFLVKGRHINSPSVLLETKAWVKSFSGIEFVDSEIGYFIKSTRDIGVNSGYLHFISNNLTNPHAEDLSNEREKSVILKRSKLNEEIRRIIYEII